MGKEWTSGNLNGREGENRSRENRDCVGLPCGGGNVRKRANKWLEEAGINIVHAQPVNSQPCREFSPSIARLSFHGRRLVRRPPLPGTVTDHRHLPCRIAITDVHRCLPPLLACRSSSPPSRTRAIAIAREN